MVVEARSGSGTLIYDWSLANQVGVVQFRLSQLGLNFPCSISVIWLGRVTQVRFRLFYLGSNNPSSITAISAGPKVS